MNQKLKVMTIVGTRPEIIRLSEVIKACDKYFNHVLVHTGQNWDYTLNEVFFKELELREPDHFLNCHGKHLGETIGNILARSYEVMQKERPEAFLALGDTNSSMAAICAKRLKIPIFHMEAGNRCFDQNVPEEINRKIIDHISDINLPYTEHSRRYLLNEGMRKEHIFVTGSPMAEVLNKALPKIENSPILEKLKLQPQKYILVSAHREENLDIDDNLFSLIKSLNTVAEQYNLPIIYSTHPRSGKKIREKNIQFHKLIQNVEPFGFFDYNKLQQNSFCVLSDSGTLSEESAMLRFPAVLIRTSTERPEVMEKGNLIIGGIQGVDIMRAIQLAIALHSENSIFLKPLDYEDLNVSTKVVRIIESYAKIIDKVIWSK